MVIDFWKILISLVILFVAIFIKDLFIPKGRASAFLTILIAVVIGIYIMMQLTG